MGGAAYPLASELVASTIASAMYKMSVKVSVLGLAVNMFEVLLVKRKRSKAETTWLKWMTVTIETGAKELI